MKSFMLTYMPDWEVKDRKQRRFAAQDLAIESIPRKETRLLSRSSTRSLPNFISIQKRLCPWPIETLLIY